MPGIFPYVLGGSGGIGGGGAFTGQAINMDGTGDATTRTGTLSGGFSSNDTGTMSFWAAFQSIGTGDYLMSGFTSGPNERIYIQEYSLWSTWNWTFKNSSGTTVLQFGNNTSIASMGTGWHHFMASWDLSASALHLYMDGSSDLRASPYIDSSGTIDWSNCYYFGVGGRWLGSVALESSVYLAEWWHSTEYIDLSSSANREKFRSASGYPVDLGSDGSTPTGTAPGIYLRLAASDSVGAFATNRAGRGDFTNQGDPAIAGSDPFP